MEINMMFEVATRQKFRFPFKGMITVEDLWDLSVHQLDEIYKSLKSQEKKAQEESLLETKTKEDEILATKIAIVRYIVEVKLDESNKVAHAREVAAQKEKLLSIIASKEDEALRNKSPEELRAMLDQLS